MPVEIKELVVRVIAGPAEREQDGVSAEDSGEDTRTAMVEDCVREVLRILRDAKER